jgi:rhomboid protease GluP
MQPSSPSPNTPRQIRLSFPVTRPRLTYVLVGAIVAVFFLQLILLQQNFPAPEPITPWGAMVFERIVNHGEYYRFLTAMFIHLSETHLFMNALSLYFIGRRIEAYFGRPRFLIMYLLGGLSGSLASFMFTRGASAGASGAIFALLGAELTFLWINRRLLGVQGRAWFQETLFLVGLNVMLGIAVTAVPGAVRIDNWGHVGGFFAGVVLTWFIGPHYTLKPEGSQPDHFRLADQTTVTTTWRVPAIYAVSMVAALMYAIVNFR